MEFPRHHAAQTNLEILTTKRDIGYQILIDSGAGQESYKITRLGLQEVILM